MSSREWLHELSWLRKVEGPLTTWRGRLGNLQSGMEVRLSPMLESYEYRKNTS